MKLLKNIAKGIGILLGTVVLAAVLLFGYLTIAEYRPDDTEDLVVETGNQAPAAVSVGDRLRIVSWNVGYGALGDNADFFMDGGSSVYTADEARIRQNLAGITAKLEDLAPQVIFLQETDVSSSRSRKINEKSYFAGELPHASSTFAYNFLVKFVPYPVPPIGKVESGIMTLSDYGISSAERITLPCPFSWPVRTANLKRCLLISRVPLEGSDRELVLINLHLEAYDSGEGKIAQTRMLLDVLQAENRKGNYIIAGGDFNQTFSNVDLSAYPAQEGLWAPGIIDEADFAGSFGLYMDASHPSCRSLERSYTGENKKNFQFYVIDGFIVSANVQVDRLENLDLEFACTDHNPVVLDLTLTE